MNDPYLDHSFKTSGKSHGKILYENCNELKNIFSTYFLFSCFNLIYSFETTNKLLVAVPFISSLAILQYKSKHLFLGNLKS